MDDCLFLGGPLDGQWMQVGKNITTWTWKERFEFRASHYDMPNERRVIHYFSHTMVNEEAGIRQKVFTPQGVVEHPQNLYARFLEYYNARQARLEAEKAWGDYSADEFNVAADFLEERDFVAPARALRELAKRFGANGKPPYNDPILKPTNAR